MTIEAREAPFADGLSEDRERAQKVAARRRQRRQFVEIAIRVGSLAAVLSIWEIFGARIDPVLFTTPSKIAVAAVGMIGSGELDRKSTRLNSSHANISYAVFCLKKKSAPPRRERLPPGSRRTRGGG